MKNDKSFSFITKTKCRYFDLSWDDISSCKEVPCLCLGISVLFMAHEVSSDFSVIGNSFGGKVNEKLTDGIL